MQIKTQEHQDLMAQFEREPEYKGRRLDREAKHLWSENHLYADGQTNDLFLAYRRGYALARCVYMQAAS